jgi:glycosyltransferase involved in cell wall biosynthesis
VAARIYVSRRLAEAARDPAGVVIPGGVDFSLFAPVDRAEARKRLDIDPDEPVALFGARPEQAAKRYDIFRAVLSAVRARGVPVRELLLATPALGRAEVSLKFAAADVLLFTSQRDHEGSPTVVKEATVMGLPVVSTDVGDVSTVLDGVRPSAVVGFPPDWPRQRAVDEVVEGLARHAAEMLGAPTRSNGRERNGWLDSARIAERVAGVYRGVAAGA